MTAYNRCIFIIEQKDSTVLHDFSDLEIKDLEKELVHDIETDLGNWAWFGCIENEIQEHKRKILVLLEKLKPFSGE